MTILFYSTATLLWKITFLPFSFSFLPLWKLNYYKLCLNRRFFRFGWRCFWGALFSCMLGSVGSGLYHSTILSEGSDPSLMLLAFACHWFSFRLDQFEALGFCLKLTCDCPTLPSQFESGWPTVLTTIQLDRLVVGWLMPSIHQHYRGTAFVVGVLFNWKDFGYEFWKNLISKAN